MCLCVCMCVCVCVCVGGGGGGGGGGANLSQTQKSCLSVGYMCRSISLLSEYFEILHRARLSSVVDERRYTLISVEDEYQIRIPYISTAPLPSNTNVQNKTKHYAQYCKYVNSQLLASGEFRVEPHALCSCFNILNKMTTILHVW